MGSARRRHRNGDIEEDYRKSAGVHEQTQRRQRYQTKSKTRHERAFTLLIRFNVNCSRIILQPLILGGHRGRGRGRGGRRDRGGRDQAKFQGKKTKFDSDDEADEGKGKFFFISPMKIQVFNSVFILHTFCDFKTLLA